ncbi:MAG: ATP-binding protein [Patescibacteria group bacterium]
MQLQVYSCLDKVSHDSKSAIKEHLLQFPKPFSLLLIGPSNCGKTNLIKNIVSQNDFKIVYVMHADEFSKDYDDIPHIKYEISEDYIERFREYSELPKVLIIDDIDFRNMKKQQQNWFYKMLTYTRTHANLTILSTVQDAIYYPPIIRRTFPIVVVYRYINLVPLKDTQALNVLDKKKLAYSIQNLTKSDYDFILINNMTKRAWISIMNRFQLLIDNSGDPYYKDSESSDSNSDSE